jgi:hypothetical protein
MARLLDGERARVGQRKLVWHIGGAAFAMLMAENGHHDTYMTYLGLPVRVFPEKVGIGLYDPS